MASFFIDVKSFRAISCGVDKDGLLFDADAEEYAVYEFIMPLTWGSSLLADLSYRNVSVQSGTNKINWGVSIMAVTSGDDADVTVDSYDTENEGVDTLANNQGANRHRKLAVTCSNVDSLAAGDFVRLKVARKATDPNMTGDANLHGCIVLRWTDA